MRNTLFNNLKASFYLLANFFYFGLYPKFLNFLIQFLIEFDI